MKFKPKKSLGQNFLVDKNILKEISDLGRIEKNDTVVEIGPGSGNLTFFLRNNQHRDLILFEKDKKLSNTLSEKFKDNIKIFNEDFLKINDNKLNYKNIKVFGNLPYNVSTQILTKLIKLSSKIDIKLMILMFQKEVADRILAQVNTRDYGRLAIISQWKMNIKKIRNINPQSFFPSPKIVSTLLEFKPKKQHFKFRKVENLEHVTRVIFNTKRKMIKKPIKVLFKNNNKIFEKLKIDPNIRPQKISNILFYKICEEYEKLIN